MTIEKPKNSNYAAVVVKLESFVDLPNCDNVKAALVFGNSVIVSKDAKAGDIGLFFPVETQIMREFIAENSLYRKSEWGNVDPEKKGFFEEHGRVKALKFRGHKSEGFYIPISSLAYLAQQGEITVSDLSIGDTFDCLGSHVICKKYIPRFQSRVGSGRQQQKSQAKQIADKIVEGQFAFHEDTENLRRNMDKIHPNQYISVSTKIHGTSAVFANVLVQRDLKWYERILKRFGVAVQEQEYGFVWSSRRVIKGVNGEAKQTAAHYYSEDIWGKVAGEVKDRIPKGYTVYGEVVGYTSDGAAIQKGYHYGCQSGQHRLYVYRVTCTNADGKVIELSWRQMQDFCAKWGFERVPEVWYGLASNFGSAETREMAEQGEMRDWRERWLRELGESFVDDRMCPLNSMEVPAEGVVVRIDDGLDEFEAFKLKSFLFLSNESAALDKGEVDIETQESEDSDEDAAA